jgi:hypothetical protein
MKNKDKMILLVFVLTNILLLFFLIVPLVSKTINTFSPYIYYGFNKADKQNIEVKSVGVEFITFSNGEVVKVSEMPWWYQPLNLIVFFTYSGPILLIIIILFNIVGLKLPFKLKT